MKSKIKIFVILLSAVILSSSEKLSAQTKADIFLFETPITWLGVDYSDMRYIGLLDVSTSQLDDYAKSINDIIVKEPKKYNLTSAFEKQSVVPNLKYIEKENAAMDTEKVITTDSKDFSRYTKDDISKIVKAYELKETGIGLVFIAEALNKTDESGAFWVTFVDMKNESVLFTERIIGKPAGFGFRNYWAGAFYSCLKQIKGTYYKQWKK
ncbi:MAG: hypothetical protein KA444_08215 [Bacteroidia bacterium]|nr:hypothetical protein [Bacteroidia bacterium]